MKFNQYIHILLVAGSALVALLILIASGSRGFLFCRLVSTDILGQIQCATTFRTTSAVVTFFIQVNVSASGFKVCSERDADSSSVKHFQHHYDFQSNIADDLSDELLTASFAYL